MARKRRPGRKGGVADGAGPAPLPGLAVMRVRDGVLSSGRRGDDWRGALRRRVYPITVLQFLVDDYDQLSFGFAARGPRAARAAAAVDEVFADVHWWARHRDGGLARQGVLLVQQRRLVLPGPNVGSWHHVHSHADHRNEASVCGPVL